MGTCSGLWAHPAAPRFPLSSSDLYLKPGTSTTSSRKPSLSTPAQRAWDKCLCCSCSSLSPRSHKCLSYNMSRLVEAQAAEDWPQTSSSPLPPASSPAPSGEWRSDVGADDRHWGADGREQTQPSPSTQRQAPSESRPQSWLALVGAGAVWVWFSGYSPQTGRSCQFIPVFREVGVED